MKIMLSYVEKKICSYPRLGLFLICFIIGIIPVFGMTTLNISDELGTISNAAFVAGYDWSSFVQSTGLAFYKYGSSLIYIPFFWVLKNPVYVYKSALIICSALVSLIPVFSYNISTILFEKNRRIVHFAISFLIGILPVNLLWSKQVWSESMLMLIPWIVAYLLLVISKKTKYQHVLLGALAVILSFGAYTVHSRGISLVCTVFVIDLFYYLKEKKWLIHPVNFTIVMVLCVILDKGLDSYFRQNIWSNVNGDLNNSADSILKTLVSLKDIIFSFRGLKIFVKTILSWSVSFFLSSFGIIVIGIVVCGKKVIAFFKESAFFKNTENMFVIFVTVYFLCSLGIGLLFFFPAGLNIFYLTATERIDKVLYLRYVSGAFTLLMFCAISYIFIEGKDFLIKNKKAILGIAGFIIFIYCIYSSDYLAEGLVAFVQVLPLPIFLKVSVNGIEHVSNFNYHIIIGLILCITLLIALFLIKAIKLKKYCFIFVGLFCLATYIWSVLYTIYPIDQYYKEIINETQNVLDRIDCSEEYPYIVVKIPRTIYAYQFAFPDYKVVMDEKDAESANYIIVDNDTDMYVLDEYYMIENVENNLILKGDSIKNYFIENGFEVGQID